MVEERCTILVATGEKESWMYLVTNPVMTREPEEQCMIQAAMTGREQCKILAVQEQCTIPVVLTEREQEQCRTVVATQEPYTIGEATEEQCKTPAAPQLIEERRPCRSPVEERQSLMWAHQPNM